MRLSATSRVPSQCRSRRPGLATTARDSSRARPRRPRHDPPSDIVGVRAAVGRREIRAETAIATSAHLLESVCRLRA